MAKILIVEDDYYSFVLLKEILTRHNFEIIHAESGKKFYEIINQESKIDLILMDIRLSDIDGITLSKYVIDNGLNIPIIICTAYTDMQKEICKLGIKHTINKPVSRELFLSYIEEYIPIIEN
jgi:DNA-binding NtrC family response regulator